MQSPCGLTWIGEKRAHPGAVERRACERGWLLSAGSWFWAAALTFLMLGCERTRRDSGEPASASRGPQPRQGATRGADAFPSEIEGRLVLARLPATADGQLRYELSLGACTNGQCPVQVGLLEGEVSVDQASLEWPAPLRSAQPEAVTPGWGAGDPTGIPTGLKAWRMGQGEGLLSVLPRTIRLTPELNGLFVDSHAGFDPVARRHELWVVRSRVLYRVWAQTGAPQNGWSAAAFVPLADGSESLVFFDGYRSPVPEEPDQLAVQSLSWIDGALTEPADLPLDALVIPGFASAASAHQTRAAEPDCLATFWILPASRFSAPPEPGFVLALPFLSEPAARRAADCPRGQSAQLRRMRPPVESSEAGAEE